MMLSRRWPSAAGRRPSRAGKHCTPPPSGPRWASVSVIVRTSARRPGRPCRRFPHMPGPVASRAIVRAHGPESAADRGDDPSCCGFPRIATLGPGPSGRPSTGASGLAAPRATRRRDPLACSAPWTTRSRPSPTPSARASRRTSRTSTGRSSRSSTCPRRSRARCSRATRATRARCGGCSSTSSPTRCPSVDRRVGRGRGRARRAALRADLPRLRRRLGRAARRRARRLRVGLERADEGAAAPAARRLPRAVDALHRLRRADARAAATATTATRRSGREYERAMDALFDDLRRSAAARHRVGRRAVPAPRRRAERRARARDQGQGARPPARPAAGRVAVAHGHLRHRPDLRAADPAPARAPAARGARATGG